MIHFDRVPEPSGFDENARKKGNQWLEEHPDATRPPDYWNTFKPELAEGFKHLCAYTAMNIPYGLGTVDHYISVKNNIMLAYEWGNYRYAQGWINSSKQNADDAILDPFDVEDGWFEIILPSLQLVVSENVPEQYREKAEYTLNRLPIRDDERIIRQRKSYYDSYCRKEISMEGLKRWAPLIAAAVEKQLKPKG